MAQTVGVAQAAPLPPPGLQEATKKSTVTWQQDLESLFHHTKDRFPDVVWELSADDEYEPSQPVEEIYGHKAVVYARAPPSFQSRYFSCRPNEMSSPLPYSSSPVDENYLADSTVSLGFGDQPNDILPRTPSPVRAGSPLNTIPATNLVPSTFLRLTTSMNPTIFSNELEYLYTGRGFGEAFEFLFDESREHTTAQGNHEDAEALRIDKLRKDLVFMWRSRLYSDVRISLTGNFGGSHESTTAIFSSHRFILVSRSSYFHNELLAWPNKSRFDSEPPTITLHSPPFTPASLHFTLGFIYTGTLVFSHRSYDLSTAFAILRAALYLDLSTLHDEIQARIIQEMLHGLFHAFLPFNEYERLTAGRWGTGGCRCRHCARRVPRVLEFALDDSVKNPFLERGARRALVGLFGEGWCNSDFASLPQKIRENALVGLGKRTTVQNSFSLLFAAEHALSKLGSQIEPWADIVREMILTARKAIDDVIAKEAEACFNAPEWVEILENDGVRFEDGERVEWVMAAVLRGVKDSFAPSLYQTLVSSIILRPHPVETNAPYLTATSQILDQVEQTRLELLKWIGHRWLAIRQEKGFDILEGWALKEISDHIEVPVEDLLSPPTYSRGGPNPKRAQPGLRPMSNHPHTSKIDADSEIVSSMRVSVLSRSVALREQPSLSSKDSGATSSRRSVRSVAKSSMSRATTSTVSATPLANKRAKKEGFSTISPARRLANEVRAKERPDSKLSPSIVKPDEDIGAEEDDERNSILTSDGEQPEFSDDQSLAPSVNIDDSTDTLTPSQKTPVKKVLITRASLASLKSAVSSDRPSKSAPSLKPSASIKSSTSAKSQSTLRSTVVSGTTTPSRPNSRGSTRSSRLNVSVTGSGPRARAVSRPISRLSNTSTSLSLSTKGTLSSRPTSGVSTSTTTSETNSTFQTASDRSTVTHSRSRRTSAMSNSASTGQRPRPVAPQSSRSLSGQGDDSVPVIPKKVINEHKKTNSSASTSSNVTLKRKDSADTIKTLKSAAGVPSLVTEHARMSKELPLPPPDADIRSMAPIRSQLSFDSATSTETLPRGAMLEVGIPCIISSKRKRFKAYARYIGEIVGETGPWVGVEVPIPIGDWGDTVTDNKLLDERQWHDGSWGGIRYFEIDSDDNRAPRRRRLDQSGGLYGDSPFGKLDGKGLKREGDQLSITSDRMKRMRSVSPAVSDVSGTESRGLFVRPSQVIYVVDAVGADL